MANYRFPCGCQFPIIGESNGTSLLDFNIEDVPANCPAVWNLLSKGLTVGIFQLEKSLGQDWSKKLMPESIAHLAALGALLRPGPLNARNDHGVSMTEMYCRRKNKQELIDFPHPALEPILGSVYGVCVYQENLMRLASDIAGYLSNEVESLRKSVGKKDMKKLMALKASFLEGCDKSGIVLPDVALMIWSWIEAAGRYSFCMAHAMAYAVITYYCAWAKAHNPLYFFTAWLSGTRFKNSNRREEIAILVEDASRFSVKVNCPKLVSLESFFYTDGQGVYFGLADVKGVGEKSVDIIRDKVNLAETQLKKPLATFTWFELFAFVLTRLSSAVVNKLIRAGACDYVGIPRLELLAQHNAWNALTAGEQSWIHDALDLQVSGLSVFQIQSEIDRLVLEKASLDKDSDEFATNKADLATFRRYLKIAQADISIHSIDDMFTAVANHYVKPIKRDEVLGHLQVLRSGTHRDSARSIVMDEEELLGIAVSAHRLDQADLSESNCTISEYLAGKSGQILLGVEIVSSSLKVTAKGKNPGRKMAVCVLRDRTGTLRSVCFPDAYANCGHLLSPGSLLLVHGERDKKDPTQMFITNAWMPSVSPTSLAYDDADVPGSV